MWVITLCSTYLYAYQLCQCFIKLLKPLVWAWFKVSYKVLWIWVQKSDQKKNILCYDQFKLWSEPRNNFKQSLQLPQFFTICWTWTGVSQTIFRFSKLVWNCMTPYPFQSYSHITCQLYWTFLVMHWAAS